MGNRNFALGVGAAKKTDLSVFWAAFPGSRGISDFVILLKGVPALPGELTGQGWRPFDSIGMVSVGRYQKDNAMALDTTIQATETRLRLLGKVAAFAGMVFGAFLVAAVAALIGQLVLPAFDANIIFCVAASSALLAVTWTCARVFEGQSIRAVGVGLDRPWVRHLIIGGLLGGVCCTLSWGLCLVGPWALARMNPNIAGEWQTLPAGALVCFFAAAYEELAFRGYGFQVLARRSKLLAVGLTGCAFAAIHLPNSGGLAPVAILNIVLGHLLFLACYWRTRSLWFPIGLHAAYNFFELYVLGVPVQTELVATGILETELNHNLWTGSDFGLLGGLAATACLAVFLVAVWRGVKQRHPAEDLLRVEADPAA